MKTQGFTLVELILVVVLLGILSATAVALFGGRDTFSAIAARAQFIAIAMLAQKRALANSADATPVSVSLVQTAPDWLVTVEHNGTTFVSNTINRASATIMVNGAVINNGQTVIINYATDGHVGTNYQWQLFSADQSYSFCITSTGFSHSGNCQP